MPDKTWNKLKTQSISDKDRERMRMTDITTNYSVKFVNHYEEFNEPLEICFEARRPEDVKAVISALAAFYSGDPYECFINGENAVLDKDWGLA